MAASTWCSRRWCWSTSATGAPGFAITRVLEPKPTDEFRAADPEHYEELMREPVFLCIQAVRR
jgi:hypothetical protein